MARIGMLLDRTAAERRWNYGINVFGRYIGEVLAHVGVPFRWFEHVDEVAQADCDILLVAMVDETESATSVLCRFAERGGTVIGCANMDQLAEKLGCELIGQYEVGYAVGLTDNQADPIRFLKARPWRVKEPNKGLREEVGVLHKDRPDGATVGSVLQRFTVGQGTLERFAIDIPDSIVRFQQGTDPVLTDGVPAPDGTGAVNENILKADDRVGMDWDLDRLFTESGDPYFAYPYADYWREVLIAKVLKSALEMGLTLPFVGYWPDGVEQVAMISHDSDHNLDIHAEATLNLLAECEIQTTWCMLEPGYSSPIYQRVLEAGHEVAFHYNALNADGGKWGEAEFDRQMTWLKNAARIDTVWSNKNHYTRFEGWSELFTWCEKHGVASDQTRGPSKKGNVGFLFGTCHPYFPIAWATEENRMLDVVEMSFLTQDMDLSPNHAGSSIIVPFLNAVKRVQGLAHFLFHPIHIEAKESVRNALRAVVREARARGFVFWTGQQVNDWYRARRSIRIDSIDEQGVVQCSGTPVPGAVVWVPLVEGRETPTVGDVEMRFGVLCRKQSLLITTTANQM